MNPVPRTTVGRAAAALIVFFLSSTAMSLVTIDRLKYVFRAEGRPTLGHLLAGLTPLDCGLLGLVGLSGLAVLLTGIRYRAAIRLFAGEQPVWLGCVTAAALVWMGHAVMAPGLLVTGDAGTHVARVSHLSAAIQGGDSLYWDNYFFGGSTLLQFTGPVFHWFAAATTLVVEDATTAIKICVSIARALAALFAYLLVRRMEVGRPAACLAALFYGGAFQLTYMEVVRSSFPQLINFAAMPAILYCIECVWRRPAALGAPVAGLVLAAVCLIGCHQPTAMIFAGYAGIFVSVRIWMNPSRRSALPALVVAGVLTGLASSFFLVPFALERGMTADNFSTGSLISLAPPTAESLHIFAMWGSAGRGMEYATYLGVPMLLCVIVGGILSLRRTASGRPKQVLLWWLMFGLAMLSMFVRGAYVRQNTFTLLFLSAAAALGADLLFRTRPRAVALPLLAFAAVAIDQGPLAMQPWNRADMAGIAAAGRDIARRAADSRVMEVWYPTGQPDVSVGPDSTPLHYARVQMLSGPHKQDATPAHNAGTAVLKIASADLKATGTLSATTRNLLALSNIGWVVGTGPAKSGLPNHFAATLPDPILGPYWRILEASPYVVSGRLEQAGRPTSFDSAPFWNTTYDAGSPDTAAAIAAVLRFQSRMGADPAAHTARTILVPAIPPGEAWHGGTGEPPVTRQRAYTVEPGRVRLSIDADRPGFIRLVHPMAATVSVYRDGEPVPAIADVESLIVLPIHAGVNEIALTASPSRLRQMSLLVSATAVVASILLLCVGTVRSRRRRGFEGTAI